MELLTYHLLHQSGLPLTHKCASLTVRTRTTKAGHTKRTPRGSHGTHQGLKCQFLLLLLLLLFCFVFSYFYSPDFPAVPNPADGKWWVMWTIRLSKNQQLPYTVVFFSTDWQDYDTDSHFSQISRGTGTRDYTDYFNKTRISTHLTPSLTKRQSK